MKTFLHLVTFVATATAAYADPPPRAHLQVFGDLWLPDNILARTGTAPETPALFGDMRELLDSAAFNVVNLEGAVTSTFVPFEPKRFLLKMPFTLPSILRSAGIDGVTLANNHAMDFGIQGLHDTLWSVRAAGLLSTGAGMTVDDALRPILVPAGETSFCIISLSRVLPESFWANDSKAGTAFAATSRVRTEVENCARQHLLPIVVYHWGAEMRSTAQEYQRQLAHDAIDAGAVAVFGHHPHVLQGSEIYKDRLIVYSLGNFAFGSSPLGSNPQGLAARIFVEQAALRYELVPLVVDNGVVRFKPRSYAPGEEKAAKRALAAPAGCTWSSDILRWTCILPRFEVVGPYAKAASPAIGL